MITNTKTTYIATCRETENHTLLNLKSTSRRQKTKRQYKPNIKCIQEHDIGQHPEIIRKKHMHASIAVENKEAEVNQFEKKLTLAEENRTFNKNS